MYRRADGIDLSENLKACPALRSLRGLRLSRAGDGDEDGLDQIARRLRGLAEAFRRSRSLADLELHLDMPPPAEALAELAALAAAAARPPRRLELHLMVDPATGWAAAAAAALAAHPPRRLVLTVPVDRAALEAGRLDALSAFAACPAGDLQVRLWARPAPDGAGRAGCGGPAGVPPAPCPQEVIEAWLAGLWRAAEGALGLPAARVSALIDDSLYDCWW
eukprot:tig00020996_g16934.t1